MRAASVLSGAIPVAVPVGVKRRLTWPGGHLAEDRGGRAFPHCLPPSKHLLSKSSVHLCIQLLSLPGGARGQEPACHCSRHQSRGFDPWVGKIPWRRKWRPLRDSCRRIPRAEEPGGLQSTGSRAIEHTRTQFSSVAQPCPVLCDLVDCSTPGLPVHHQLPEFTQTRVHRAGDAIQPSHPLWSPSSTFNLSQHQGLFK